MGKEKYGFTLDKQIDYLKNNKNVDFEGNEEVAKQYLQEYSYSDIINPLKVLFCSGYNTTEKNHEYDNKTKWIDIQNIHKQLKDIEVKTFGIVMQLELEIKAKLCNYIANEINSNEDMDFKIFLEKLENRKTRECKESFYQMNEKSYNEKYHRDYDDYEDTNFVTRWYLLIMSLSVSDLNMILRTTYEGKNLFKHIKFEKFDYYQLEEFRILRNSLAHGTSILIFLDKPFRKKCAEPEDINKHLKNRKKLLKKLLNGEIARHGVLEMYEEKRNNHDGKRQEYFSLSEYKI